MTASRRPAATGERPLLGIIACNREVGGEIAASVMQRYLEAAATCMDVSLVIVPSLPEHVDAPRLARAIDGLLLTGSPSNVAPERYGEADPEAAGPFDPGRDAVAQGMLAAMGAVGKPVFGICRGLQEINVALGGTLRRDLATPSAAAAGALAHHADADAGLAEMFGFGHEVVLAPGGRLAAAFDTPTLQVNSVHYQGIDRLAEGLAVEARAPDGLVEAVSGRIGRAPVIAVQWHPEWRPADIPASRRLLAHFGAILRGNA